MKPVIAFFAERRLLVNLLAVGLILFGYMSATGIPREYLPAARSHIMFVSAELPGASARDVESKVVIPIQEAIEEVDGVDSIESTISNGSAYASVEFFVDSSEEELDQAERRLRDAIEGITDFPPEMDNEPKIERLNPAKWPMVQIALSGPEAPLAAATRMVERAVKSVPGVAQAEVVGLNDPEVRVLVDPQKATEQGVTILEVVDAVRRRNVSNTGGVLESSSNRNRVVLWSRFHAPEEVGETIVRSLPGEAVVRVSQIARIESGREDTGLIAHTDGAPGVTIYAIKRDHADAIDAVDSVKAAIDSLDLPSEVSVDLVDDRAFYTENRLNLMLVNGAYGGLLVALVLLFFMRGGAVVWVCAAIPLVFFAAIALMPAFGMTFNIFSLTGFVIVIGMVVDDAVVVAENIDTKRRLGFSSGEAAIAGTSEMVKPITAAALTTMLAFTPLLSMGGLIGTIIWQIPAVVVAVLIFSLFESFFVLPAHMAHRTARQARRSRASNARARGFDRRAVMARLESLYAKSLRFTIRRRVFVVPAYLLLLVAVFTFIRPLLEIELFSQQDATVLWAKVSTPIGTPIERTEALVLDLEAQVADIAKSDLESVSARIGHQSTEDNNKTRGDAGNEALLTLVFDTLGRQHTNAEWIGILQRELEVPEDTSVIFQSQYLGPPTDQPITVHFMSNDDEVRRASAARLLAHLRDYPDLVELEIDERPGTPQVELNLDYEKLALAGLDARIVADTLLAAFHGIEASEHRDIEDTTGIRVMFDPASRSDLDALMAALVRSRSGDLVPLRDLVNPVEQLASDRIFHRDGVRTTTLRGSFTPDSDFSAVSFATYLEQSLFPAFDGVAGLEVRVGGEAEQTRESGSELGQAALLAVVGIGLVIWLLLGSLLHALSVMIVIPFSVAAVMFVFWAHGINLSVTAFMSIVGLAGVVVNASIVMLDSVNRRLSEAPPEADKRELAIDAMVARLRPILITTLTTFGGVMPTAYGIGGYDAIVSPMSLVIGWGLVITTFVTLFLVPALYTFAEDMSAEDMRAFVGRKS